MSETAAQVLPQPAPLPLAAPSRMPLREVELILFIGGILSAYLYTSLDFLVPNSGFGEPVRIARNLVDAGAFANPFVIETGPSAHSPPLLVAFLALVYQLAGGAFFMVMAKVTCAVHGLHAALLPRVSMRFFSSMVPGMIAAGFAVLLPVFKVMPGWEAMFVATGLMAYCLFSSWLLRKHGPRPWVAVLVAMAAAVLVYLNPLSGPITVAWLAFQWCRLKLPTKDLLRFAAVFILLLGATILPWTIRNYLVFDKLVFLRDDFGLALYSSNNDCAEPLLAENIESGCHYQAHPFANPAEARLVAQFGEVAYNQKRLADAEDWIRDHPGRFLELTARRLLYFWFPWNEILVLLGTLAGFIGLALMAKDRLFLSSFVLFVFLTYPVIYYFVEAQVRYRYPILWLSLLCGGYGVHQVWARFHERTPKSSLQS